MTVERRPNGQFETGHSGTVKAGVPYMRARIKRMIRENPERADAIIDKLARMAEEGNLRAIGTIIDQTDGLLAMKVEGLSDADIRERIGAVLVALKKRLPEQYHPVISDVARTVLVEGGEDNQ